LWGHGHRGTFNFKAAVSLLIKMLEVKFRIFGISLWTQVGLNIHIKLKKNARSYTVATQGLSFALVGVKFTSSGDIYCSFSEIIRSEKMPPFLQSSTQGGASCILQGGPN